MNNTMLRRVMCLLWLYLAYLPAHAQTETPSSTTDSLPTRYKWEVATDLLWLLDKNTMPATSVFIRRHTEKGAWRLRVGGSYKRKIYEPLEPDNVTPSPKALNDGSTSILFVRFGYERKIKSSKFDFYYGGDLNFEYTYQKANDFYSLPQQGQLQGYNAVMNSHSYDVGLYVFLGIRKYLHPQISISGEFCTWVSNSFTKYRQNTYESPIDATNSTQWAYYNESLFRAGIQPLCVFNISYHFKK